MRVSYFPTKHAVAAMASRDVTWAEVLEVVTNPEVTYQNSSHGAHAGKDSHIRQRGNLYAVVSDKVEFDRHDTGEEHPMQAVVTVGLRQQRQWTNGDARNRSRP